MKRTIPVILLIVVMACVSMTVLGQAKKAEKARDPVCGIMVEKNPELSYSYKGETYYFCSKADIDKFKQTPDKYVKK